MASPDLQASLRQHQAGNLDAAIAGYRAFLHLEPQQAEMRTDAVMQQRRESAHFRLLPFRRFTEDTGLLFQEGTLKPARLRTQVPEPPEE